MAYHYHAPLDPDCPEARKIYQWAEAGYNDPLTEAYGASDVIDDVLASKERKHRSQCKRCQDYGAANIEVQDN